MTTIWAGLSLGSLYAIVALTFNVTLASTGVFNFAQSQIVMVGTFTSYVAIVEHHWPWGAALVLSTAVGAAIGFIEERIAIRPMSDDRGLGYLVTTVGASVAIEGVIYIKYGTNARNLSFVGGSKAFSFLGGRLEPVDVTALIVAFVLTAALHLMSQRSGFGLASRAMTVDRDAAAIRGVNVRRVSLLAFTGAGALGGAAGLLVGPTTGVSYDTGGTLVVFGFMVLAVGGFGSYTGALIGGLAIGLIQEEAERYLSLGYPLIVLYAVLLVLLLLRPTGMFGRRNLRVV